MKQIHCISVIAACIVLGLAWTLRAADVTLDWALPTQYENDTPVAKGDIGGVTVYWGTSSSNYTDSLDVGLVSSCTITGLAQNVAYYIAASAYSTVGTEGLLCQELTWARIVRLGPVFNLRVVVNKDSTLEIISSGGGQ